MARLVGEVDFQPVVSRYVGAPIEEAAETLQVLQDRYDQNLAAKSRIETAIANEDLMGFDEELKEDALNTFHGTIDDIIKNENYEDANFLLSKAATQYATNQELIKARKNKQTVNQQREAINAIKHRGGNPLVFSDENNQGLFFNEDGTRKEFVSDVAMQGDYLGTMEKLFNDVKAEAHQSGLQNHPQFKMFLKHGTTTGISDKRILSMINGAKDRYMSTAEGQQHMRKLQEIDGLSGTEAAEEIDRQLLATGRERVHQSYQENYIQNPAAVQALKQQYEDMANAGIHWTGRGKALDISIDSIKDVRASYANAKDTLRQLEDVDTSNLSNEERFQHTRQLEQAEMAVFNTESQLDAYTDGVLNDPKVNQEIEDVYNRYRAKSTGELGLNGLPVNVDSRFLKAFPTLEDFRNHVVALDQEEVNELSLSKMTKSDPTHGISEVVPANYEKALLDAYSKSSNFMEERRDKFKLANDYTVWGGLEEGTQDGRKVVGVARVNEAIKDKVMSSDGGYINAVNGEEITTERLRELGGTEDNPIDVIREGSNEEMYRDPTKDRVLMTDGAANGKMIYELQLRTKEGEVIKTIPLASKSSEHKDDFKDFAHKTYKEVMKSNPSPNEALKVEQLMANANFLPHLSQYNIYAGDETQVMIPGYDAFTVVKVGQTSNGMPKFKIRADDNTSNQTFTSAREIAMHLYRITGMDKAYRNTI